MRKIFLNLFFRFYEEKSYKMLNEKQANNMFDFIAKKKKLKHFGSFFRQMAAAYRNKYLYTNDPEYKGSALAMTQVAEKFEEHLPKTKEKEKERQKKFVGKKKSHRIVKY